MIRELDEMLATLFVGRVPDIVDAGQIGFGPPDADWRNAAAGLDTPALNVHLVDLRENTELRSNWRTRTFADGGVADRPAPALADCHYLISAWSASVANQGGLEPAIEEHEMLYAVTVALMDAVPLNGSRIYGPVGPPQQWIPEYQPFFGSDLPARVLPAEGFPKYAELWGTMGDSRPWRPAVYLIVTLPVVSRRPAVTGPLVRTLRSTVGGETLATIGGTVRDPQGVVPGATVVLDTVATPSRRLRRAGTDDDGRFRFGAIRDGRYRLTAASDRHAPVTRDIEVPALDGSYDLELT